MNKRLGTYTLQKNTVESFKTYLPPPLPPDPALDLQMLSPKLQQATQALAELNDLVLSLPNTALFTSMFVRKEALLSSHIAGAKSSFADLVLFESNQEYDVSLEDVEDVSNYVQAMSHGLERIKNGSPLSLRLLREIHGMLLSGTRGADKLPGEFRRSQNWLDGTRPGNALFVPPTPEQMLECLSDLEKFIHHSPLPVLIKAGLAHVQLQTIHPFLEGNGRMSRLLLTLLLSSGNLLEQPVLCFSLYLKQHKQKYYNRLQEVRTLGSWEALLEFFLDGMTTSAEHATQTINEITTLFAADTTLIETLGRVRFSSLHVFDFLKKLPIASVPVVSAALDISAPTARNALTSMAKLGILKEINGKKRDKTYVYSNYLGILERE